MKNSKKIFLSVLALFSLVVLSGCSSDQATTKPADMKGADKAASQAAKETDPDLKEIDATMEGLSDDELSDEGLSDENVGL